MALAISFEQAKNSQLRNEGDASSGTSGGALNTPFFNFPDNPDLPHAALSQRDPGRISRAHFHVRDQFQVVVAGSGSIGRHELHPYCVHFSHAYTPYGPLASNPKDPMTFFVMRTRRDAGSQRLPQKREQLKQTVGRHPWQITRPVTFDPLQFGAAIPAVSQRQVPDIQDEQGLAVYTLSMRPNVQTIGPDASTGDGQYLIVVKGSILYSDKEHKALALVFIHPHEGALRIHAGPEGLDALVLNFPRPAARG